MITVKEIARMCGVSASTVSNVLNGRPNVGEESKQKVLAAVKQTGYHPNYFAASIRKQKSELISIIVEDLCQFSTPPIVEEIMKYCEEHGYRTILVNLRLYDRWKDTWYQDEEKLKSVIEPALQEVESVKVDGNIYVAGHGHVIKGFPKDYAIPTVIAYAESENDRFPSVLIDDENGGYDMGKYLISRGHRQIGVISGVAGNMHSQKRLVGFKRALFEAGIPYNPQWVFYGDWQKESGYRLTAEVMETGASVIWCMNDQMAGGVYEYLYEHNIVVGRDISVAGYDNITESTYLFPRLTTNELPLREIGRQAAERMIRMLEVSETDREDMKIWVPCKMIIGNSVMKI